MPFTANPAPATPEDTIILGDGWFPSIDVNAMRDVMRIGTSVTDARLIPALENAISHVTDQLWDWRMAKQEDGKASLSDVSDRKTGDKNRLEFLFIRAVQHSAEAELFDQYNDISATGKNEDLSETKRMSADDSRRASVHAIRDIMGVRRTMSSLI